MNYKKESKGFFCNGSLIQKHMIMANYSGKWIFFGDKNGPYKFDTVKERDIEFEKLKQQEKLFDQK